MNRSRASSKKGDYRHRTSLHVVHEFNMIALDELNNRIVTICQMEKFLDITLTMLVNDASHISKFNLASYGNHFRSVIMTKASYDIE